VFEGLFYRSDKLSADSLDTLLEGAVERFNKTGEQEAKDDPNPSKRRLAKSQAAVMKSIGALRAAS
jgi:hypothetical protein